VPQYLLGKQLPYVALGLINYLILVLMAIFWFEVPIKGSFWAMSFGALLLVYVSTGLGLLVSSLVRTQVAALFVTAIVTLIPTINYSGLLYPLSSMDSFAYAIGVGFPASWYQRISIGGFTKGLGWSSFLTEYMVLTAFALAFITLASIFLKKQEV
jgi:ribosome-dependent ATPase